jgi:uncharacterized membrane protein YhdT
MSVQNDQDVRRLLAVRAKATSRIALSLYIIYLFCMLMATYLSVQTSEAAEN